jgi:hypothetical protein
MTTIFPNVIRPPPSFGKAARPLLCRLMKAITKTKEQTPAKDERTPAAAEHNSQIIQDHEYDLQECLASMPKSTVSPGSEFRHVDTLENLIGRHPYWPNINVTLTEGAFKAEHSKQHADERTTHKSNEVITSRQETTKKPFTSTLKRMSRKDTHCQSLSRQPSRSNTRESSP